MTFNKKVVYVLITMLTLFCGLVLYFSYFQIFKSPALVDAGTNPRTYVKEQSVQRGDIYDRNGKTASTPITVSIPSLSATAIRASVVHC